MRARYPLQLALHVARPLEVSRERPDAFYHLYYDELVADPLGTMRDVYHWLGAPMTPEANSGMAAWLEHNPQGRFGGHEHSLEQWGFTRAQLEPYFADYLDAHPAVLGTSRRSARPAGG